MNYLFQLRGLFNDDLLNPGAPHLDLSGQRLGGLDENNLRDIGQLGFDLDAPNGVPLYHSGWYSPRGIGSAATKHCDGSELLRDAEQDGAEHRADPVRGSADQRHRQQIVIHPCRSCHEYSLRFSKCEATKQRAASIVSPYSTSLPGVPNG